VVGLLVRLRLTLWRHGLRHSPPQIVSTIVGVVATLIGWAVFVPTLILMAGQPPRVTSATVPLFATLTLLWPVLSIIAAGVDQTLDPARFAVLPVPARVLVPGLFAAAFVGIPAVFTVGLAVGQVAAWSSRLAALPGALVGAVLGVSTCILLSRVLTTGLARVMTSRRGREIGAVVISFITLAPLGFNLLIGRGATRFGTSPLDAGGMAEVAGWTPVGWAWALPDDLARRRWGSAAVHLVLAVLLVALLWWLWVRLLARVLTSPLVAGGGQRIGTGRLLPRLLGTSPAAAIATRRIRAWRRDSRLVSIGMRTMILPIVLIAQGLLVPDAHTLAPMGAVILAMFSGLTLMNDLAFDGPPWWVHLAAGVPGRDDRLGRVIASTAVFGPITLGTFAVAVALGLVDHPVAWLAVVVAGLLSSMGIATLVGAYLPGTAPRTGGNPFAAQSGAAAQGCVTALISFVAPAVLLIPVIVAALLLSGSRWAWAAVGGGAAWGLALLAAGVIGGGRRLDAKGPEMLGLLARAQM
jgi:ABC-2 type transport system permease protein